ncbi:putative inhibitor of apoptosis [Tachypleus tridentatus]|uniref:putative inhibitor of apoptosis n=1 Tax=Tachypleus tridentatus TaxID=6853 RepID=UPI003FCFCBEB
MTAVQSSSVTVDSPLIDEKNKPSRGHFNREEDRLKTFETWPINFPVDKFCLAKAGFYYLNREKEVVCFSCGLHLKDWDYGDSPALKHRQCSPSCSFLLGTSANVPLISSQRRNSSLLLHQEVPNEPRNIENTNIQYEHQNKLNVVPQENGVNIASHQSNGHQRNGNTQQNGDLISYHKTRLNGFSDMFDESRRLKTFKCGWPASFIKPQELAKAGFFYLGSRDRVQCPYCLGIVSSWEQGDDPIVEHLRHFPRCPFILEKAHAEKSVANPRISSLLFKGNDECGKYKTSASDAEQGIRSSKLMDVNQEHIKLEDLGINIHRGPKHSSQASLAARLRSFAAWPEDAPVRPELLAEAGFFYIGIKDHTKCFYCDGGLCSWDPGDDPWTEHAKWFCNCGFVRINKGDDFIKKCFSESKSLHNVVRPCSSNGIVSENDIIERLMQSSMIKSILQEGLFDAREVRLALSHQVQQTGMGFSTLDDLCEAVLKYRQICSEKSSDTNETGSSKEKSSSSVWGFSCHKEMSGKDKAQAQKERKVNLSKPNGDITLEKENEKLKEQQLCKICMDRELGAVFLPCGHLLTCPQCAPALEICPLCRREITGIVRTFFS